MTIDNSNHEKVQKEHIGRRTVMIGGLSVLAIGSAAGAYLALAPGGEPTPALAQTNLEELMAKGPLEENILGSADAPVTIIEYSSMTCPHCAQFHKDTLPDLKKKYIDTGKARYIIREFPLDNLAMAAFMLARCAGPKKYFPFVDTLYAQQKNWAFVEGNPVPELLKMAKQAGFTKESFEKCLSDQKLLDGLNWVRNRGNQKFKVSSTPTFFINGELLKGAQTLAAFEKMMKPHL
ncbi:MAG: DsbA family protein [Methyloligellaceae bacterium]